MPTLGVPSRLRVRAKKIRLPSGFRPPVDNSKFWATQALVIAIAAVHDAVEVLGLLPHLGMAYFLPISVFFVPVVYAALYFGLAGAISTSLWCTLLSSPNIFLWHQGSDRYGVLFQVGVINAVAIFVGSRVDGQTKARTEAEGASRALQVSETNYRTLWEDLKEKEQARSVLLKKLISAQEEERQRIARELHDEMAQGLTALLMGLGHLERSLPQMPVATADLVDNVKQFASRTLVDTRRLIIDLRPPVLDDLGLVAGVRVLAESRLEQHGVEVSLTTKGLQHRLPPHLELAIFRVLQEAINNCARHAHATGVRISLQSDSDNFEATVQDDGIGFDLSSIAQPASESSPLGLLGMRERASLLGGNLGILSKPGTGTTVTLTLPPPMPEVSA